MKYPGAALLILTVLGLPAAAEQPPAAELFAVTELDRETVPAGTPEAFEVAFGEVSRTEKNRWYEAVREVDGQSITFVPLTLIPLSEGRVALVSTGASDCTGHGCSGVNSIHYLAREDSRYRIEGEWLDVGATGTIGNPAERWGWTDVIAEAPVLYTDGGGVWQGYACSYAALTHLTPAGPVEIASFPVYFSDGGATDDEAAAITLAGRITAAEKDHSFTVSYSGTRTFSERYLLGADGHYHVEEHSQVPHC